MLPGLRHVIVELVRRVKDLFELSGNKRTTRASGRQTSQHAIMRCEICRSGGLEGPYFVGIVELSGAIVLLGQHDQVAVLVSNLPSLHRAH